MHMRAGSRSTVSDPGTTCPICGYTDCSLSHRYDRLAAPVLIAAARVLSRVFFLTAVVVVLGLAMGWSW